MKLSKEDVERMKVAPEHQPNEVAKRRVEVKQRAWWDYLHGGSTEPSDCFYAGWEAAMDYMRERLEQEALRF
jgi:hypothetical protein